MGTPTCFKQCCYYTVDTIFRGTSPDSGAQAQIIYIDSILCSFNTHYIYCTYYLSNFSFKLLYTIRNGIGLFYSTYVTHVYMLLKIYSILFYSIPLLFRYRYWFIVFFHFDAHSKIRYNLPWII